MNAHMNKLNIYLVLKWAERNSKKELDPESDILTT